MIHNLMVTALLFTCVNFSFAQVNNANKNTLNADLFATKIKQQKINPQIIDVRTKEEFLMNHINGAINIDMQQANYIKELKRINKTEPVFIYAIQTNRPDVLAKQLKEMGYGEVYELKSGIAAWIGGGYPYYSAAKNEISLNDYTKIIKGNKLVLVNVGTKYCGLCRKVKIIIDSLKQDVLGNYKIQEIELNDNPQLITNIKAVHAVPTLLLYKNGEIVWQKTGADFEKKDIETIIENFK